MVQLCAIVSLSFQSVQSVLQPQLSLLFFNTSVLMVVLNAVRHFRTADLKEAVIRFTFYFILWRLASEMHEILVRNFSDDDGESADFGTLFRDQVLEQFVRRLCPCISSIHIFHRRKGEEIWQNHQQNRRIVISDIAGRYSSFVLKILGCQMSTSRIGAFS